MTVILAFTCPTLKMSFMGADDLRHPQKNRYNKVVYLFDRFFVGGIGVDILFNTARCLRAFDPNEVLRDNGRFQRPETIEELCKIVSLALPAYAKKFPNIEKPYTGRLVILDQRAYRLQVAIYGEVLPAKTSYAFELVNCNQSEVYMFGGDITSEGLITSDIINDPFIWCSKEIKSTRERMEERGKPIIGELGACLQAKNHIIEKRSAFTSVSDMIEQYI